MGGRLRPVLYVHLGQARGAGGNQGQPQTDRVVGRLLWVAQSPVLKEPILVSQACGHHRQWLGREALI